jgi:quercetin dioxygenase-like cupin family protein
VELSEAWIDGDDTARWRSAAVHSGDASGSSLLEIGPGCRLPRHIDSAEETIVVTDGRAEIDVGGERRGAAAGELALVPEGVPHEVRNVGDGALRFAAVYASSDVTTTYEAPVQPDGERERRSTPS